MKLYDIMTYISANLNITGIKKNRENEDEDLNHENDTAI